MKTRHLLELCLWSALLTRCVDVGFPGLQLFALKTLLVILTTTLICFTAVDILRRKVSP
jgi:hypothetical protein